LNGVGCVLQLVPVAELDIRPCEVVLLARAIGVDRFVAAGADQVFDPRWVPGVAVVSAVSLIGGANLGPEKALGALGGGAGSWIAQRRKLSQEDSKLCTLSGFGGAYGGLRCRH
jgi:H+/Cl- antiporter ClcA